MPIYFVVGRNIYDYGDETVLAVRHFLSLHSRRVTAVAYDSARTEVAISCVRG